MRMAMGRRKQREKQEDIWKRVRSEYGKSLLRRRGELVERSFAHCYETGGLRRCHLRGRDNILKRQLVHVGAFNLSLILRQLLGAGTCSGTGMVSNKVVAEVSPHLLSNTSQNRVPGCAVRCAENQLLAPRTVRHHPRTASPEPSVSTLSISKRRCFAAASCKSDYRHSEIALDHGPSILLCEPESRVTAAV